MEALDGTEDLCFPHLLNSSCRRRMHPGSNAVLPYMLSFIALLTATLNLLVIISISYFRQLHTPTNLFLLSLAVSDLLVSLLVMPIEIMVTLEACWYLGDLTCFLFIYFAATITSASVGNMVFISIDRHMAICDPLRYRTKITLRRAKIYICLCWSCSFLYNVMILHEQLLPHDMSTSCHGECVLVIRYKVGVIDLLVTFIIPVTAIVVLYMRVFVVAVSQARAMRSHVVAVQSDKVIVTTKKSERKAARTLGIVIVAFLICFCPYYYPSLTGQDTSSITSYFSFFAWMLHFNSCINPMIYAFFYPWFRKATKLIVTLQILKPYSCMSDVL